MYLMNYLYNMNTSFTNGDTNKIRSMIRIQILVFTQGHVFTSPYLSFSTHQEKDQFNSSHLFMTWYFMGKIVRIEIPGLF